MQISSVERERTTCRGFRLWTISFRRLGSCSVSFSSSSSGMYTSSSSCDRLITLVHGVVSWQLKISRDKRKKIFKKCKFHMWKNEKKIYHCSARTFRLDSTGAVIYSTGAAVIFFSCSCMILAKILGNSFWIFHT